MNDLALSNAVNDLALSKFGIFLVGTLAVMLALTMAFNRREFFFGTKITDWLGVVFTLALAAFTYQLSQVASTQTTILDRTDKALNAAKDAQINSAKTAEKLRLFIEATERPWIGPTAAAIVGTPEPRKRISTTVSYVNTGKLPATLLITTLPKLFTRVEWEKGMGDSVIFKRQRDCMAAPLPANLVKVRVAYPTTGFSAYLLHVDSDDFTLAENDRFSATDKFISGDEIFVLSGCFVYGTSGDTHHSSFCFYFDHNVTDKNNLSYCQSGQRAD